MKLSLLGSTLLALVLACGCSAREKPEDATTADAIRSLAASEIVGSISYGIPKSIGTGGAEFRAFRFAGAANDEVDVKVTALGVTADDPEVWIVDDAFRTIAQNDNASEGTKDAHAHATLARSQTCYVVVRDVNLALGSFRVSLTGTFGPPGTPCAIQDEIQASPCGNCGTKERLCIADADGGIGGTWSDWGACENELPSGVDGGAACAP